MLEEGSQYESRRLIGELSKQKINQHCFEKCVPKPGSSLSSSEQSCHTMCMEKYVTSWNLAYQTYLSRAQNQTSADQLH